jgi:hypothetical protein
VQAGDVDRVSEEERQKAKCVTYGIIVSDCCCCCCLYLQSMCPQTGLQYRAVPAWPLALARLASFVLFVGLAALAPKWKTVLRWACHVVLD